MKKKSVAILQSNYIPWKGYFDLIAAADEFILFDDMQFTRRDWRNRNLIKTPEGTQWLTVPVLVKGKYYQKISETKIDGSEWQSKHWKALIQNYKNAKFFDEVAPILRPLYLDQTFTDISTLNRSFIETICIFLGISTTISNSSDYNLIDGKSERLADLCIQAGATEYISGPSAKEYIDDKVFSNANLELTWFDYDGYPEYPQRWGKFTHNVTILDLLFNCGSDAPKFMRYVV